jgi:hypothetical protein
MIFFNSTGYMPWKKCTFDILCLKAKRINIILYFNNRLRVRTMGWMRESQWCWHIVFTDAFAVLIPVLIFLCKASDKMFGCSAADLAQGPPFKASIFLLCVKRHLKICLKQDGPLHSRILKQGSIGWSRNEFRNCKLWKSS